MEAPSYNWECQVCSTGNPAGSASCAACGFPAVATGRAIRAAKQSLNSAAPEESQHFNVLERLYDSLLPLSLWRKVVAVAALIGAFFGWGLFQVAVTLRQAGVGMGLALICAATLGVLALGGPTHRAPGG